MRCVGARCVGARCDALRWGDERGRPVREWIGDRHGARVGSVRLRESIGSAQLGPDRTGPGRLCGACEVDQAARVGRVGWDV